jgi:ribulose 1,5-bisphosphate synthetase/thiazole synthase
VRIYVRHDPFTVERRDAAMTGAATTERNQPDVRDAGHVDVLIVGAGVSGIGAAHHLRERFPDRSFVLLAATGTSRGAGSRSPPATRSCPTSTRSSRRTT